MQEYGLLKARKSKDVFQIGTAEKKILITFCYYVLLTVVVLTTFTIKTRNSELFVEELSNYFACEERGNDPNNPCDRNTFCQLSYPWLSAISFMLLYMLPVVNLVYVLNIKELKEKFNITKSLKFSRTVQTNLSNMSTP